MIGGLLLVCFVAAAEAGPRTDEKLLIAGPIAGRARYYTYMPLLRPYRPWKIDWDGYPYKDFYPCVADNHLAARPPSDRPPEKVVHYNEGTRGAGVQARTWLEVHFGEAPPSGAAKCYPRRTCAVSDWRGYALLRTDVKFSADTHVWWAIEDRVVQPPVVGNFDVKGGAPATLQIDLEQAAKDRGLDLSHMWTMWIRANPPPGAQVEMSNIRLARRTAEAPHPVLDDPKAAKLPPHPKPQGPPKPDVPRDLTPLAGPRTLVYRSATPLSLTRPPPLPGFVAAYDARRVLLCAADGSFRWYGPKGQVLGFGKRHEVFAVQTLDGGRTWTGLDGDRERTWLHVTVRPVSRVIDEVGGAVLWNKDGCGNNPGPRHRLIKFSFLGRKGWTCNRTDYVFNEENYHCGTSFDDAVRAPSGRIWAAFAIAHRLFDPPLGLHVKYSDSDGRAWHTWREGRIGFLPQAGDGGRPFVVPYGDHAAVFWYRQHGPHDRRYSWSRFDGREWSTPQMVHGKYVHSAVAVGREQVLVSAGQYWGKDPAIPAGGGPGVKRFDGRTWVRELTLQGDPGVLCVAGRHVAAVALGRGGFVVRWRTPDGRWSDKPQTIPTEPVREWRAARFGPPQLAALAYIAKDDERAVKVLLVPNPHFGT